MPIPPTTYAEDLELLRASAVAAGIIASGFFRREVKSWNKENASPVSEADILVDRYLANALLQSRPTYGWLSEETADNPSRLDCERVFVVDPIDGTRGFLRGEDSWTVCLAVVEDGVPVAGVVYAPMRDELYEATRDGGARLNGKPIQRRRRPGSPPVIPAAGAVHQHLQDAGLNYTRGPYYPSLAYRLVQVATGKLDAVASRRGSQDWDIAAATVILDECGMDVADVCSGFPQFNRRDVRHGALAALADMSLKPLLHAALIEVYGCPADEALTAEPTSTDERI
ncbi:3'(2'),5'-bisphosphate nucleotidase CysQ [Devosia neptuniae]|jgi:myo-inositol-1(or 4)-monophosphatase|uniref:3'(2'),5'-bisphosphate nucleotidase CysQ n=1 Tax=Devosia TaxID=46913 RepID=UPI0022AEC123|nr:3'(2'),5'-bisphosphate nucleotidase CysQ [Devosia neptuniae]MCZ4344618.1 3'(2'),5'-bisphosphate nucleotidase CysQ [Devosia neptuniae]|tara:strand:- start:9962 stop:10813 length:852 start_codon:yes stop_codon:yes gene_type:complete